jgi:hypothetical protein
MGEKFSDPLVAGIEVPSEPLYRTLSPEELKDESVVENVAETYKMVFGSQDIWGEGYKCSNCGKTYPLEGGNPGECLSCKSRDVKEFYPLDELKDRIKTEMADGPDVHPVMSVMKKNRKIVGFLWGAVGPSQEIISRLTKKYQGNERLELSKSLHDKLVELGVGRDERILSGDELGILRSDRGSGPVPVMTLAKLWLEHGLKNNAKTAVFWTSKKSPIYAICVAGGFQPIFDTQDGISYMIHPDSRDLVAAMRDGEKSFLEFMGRGIK